MTEQLMQPAVDNTTQQRIKLEDVNSAASIFGNNDQNIDIIEKSFGITVYLDNGEIVLSGSEENVRQTAELFNELLDYCEAGNIISSRELNYTIKMIKGNYQFSLNEISDKIIYTTPRGKHIKPKTLGQKNYIQSISDNDIVFGIGPAGTGKTYLAVVMAVKALKNRTVSRLVLTRPAVEAGEKLGFLPGDLQEKINPYLRPIYDSLYDILGVDVVKRYIERGIIEIAPLAYMRGRTLDESYIILDEAQNTTREQMKMMLTRIGFNSRAVITGDITQIDLPRGHKSGLIEAVNILGNIEGIDVFNLTQADIVRHHLVQKIIEAYEKKQDN